MPERAGDDDGSGVAWRRLTRDRPWYRKLASQQLAEAVVDAPDGTSYLLRVYRNSPVAGSKDVDPGNPPSTVLGLVKANLDAAGATGWRIEVVTAARRWRSETVLYTQQVGARAIVVDVILAMTDALERGDKLWSTDGATGSRG